MRFVARRNSPFHLLISRSRIHRRGVFAAELIPAHCKVIEYKGERIDSKEALRRVSRATEGTHRRPTYIFMLRRNALVDGAVGGSGAEIINHSCRPNLITRKLRGHIFYFSRRAIPVGAELTLDYRFSKSSAKVPCCCGSSGCRGTINVK
jgi:uncharacterized protein